MDYHKDHPLFAFGFPGVILYNHHLSAHRPGPEAMSFCMGPRDEGRDVRST